MTKLLTFNDYVPGPDSRAFFNSAALENLIIGPIRCGKTETFRRDIVRKALNNRTGFNWLVCGPTYGQIYEMLERPITEWLEEARLPNGGRVLRKHNYDKHRTILFNGNTIIYRSMEDERTIDKGIRSLDVGGIHISEVTLCPKYGVDVARGRALLTNCQVNMEGTPKGRHNWLYQEYFGPDATQHPNTAVFQFKLWNNPLITQDAYDRLAAEFDPIMKRQELDGEWVSLTDKAVYYAFTRERNVQEWVKHPPQGEVTYIGLDYNIGINAWLAMWKDFRRNTIYVFDEGYGDKTTADAGRRIMQSFGTGAFILDDATGRNRQQGDARTQREILNQVGLYSIAAYASNPPVEKRQAVVNAHLCNGLNESHLFIHPRCKRLIAELETLARKPNSLDVDTLGGKAGHITDALGYGVYYLSGGTAAWGMAPEPVTRAA